MSDLQLTIVSCETTTSGLDLGRILLLLCILNVSFSHYWSRDSWQISCMVGGRNRCFVQGIQQALIESESEFGVMFGQGERLQTCVFFQLYVCILYNHVIKYERINYKRLKSRIQYYSNSVATFQLLIACGDVQTNPGPWASQLSSTNKQNNRSNNYNNLFSQLSVNRLFSQ